MAIGRLSSSLTSQNLILTSDGRIRVWRCKGERYIPECTIKTLINCGGSLMFWDCITYNGVGSLFNVPCNSNSKTYISHVYNRCTQHIFPQFWKKFLKKNPKAVFIQDNAPYHKVHYVAAWFGALAFVFLKFLHLSSKYPLILYSFWS